MTRSRGSVARLIAPEDLVRRDLTSGARVVAICQECGDDDMAERVRAEAEEST